MPENTIQIEQLGAVRLLRLNRPEALNAFTTGMLGRLRQALEAAAEDAATRSCYHRHKIGGPRYAVL